jgi:hypothetical protein
MKGRIMRKLLKVSSLIVLAVAGVSANAEEIKAVKKSAGQQVSDNLYGNVEARMQTLQFNDAAGNTQGSRDFVLRPKLGTKIFNEKLDLNLTMPIVNKQKSAKTEKARAEVEGTLSMYSSDRMDIELYTFNYLQNNESPYDGYANLDVTFKRSFDRLALGVVDASVLLEAESNLTTKSMPSTVSRRERTDGLALAADEKTNPPEQKETNKALTVYPTVAVSPSVVPGVKLALGSIFTNTYKPVYKEVINESGESAIQSDGYDVSRSTQVRYTVTYKISDAVSVYNQLRQNFVGYAESSQDVKGARLDNRTGITMSLF